MGTIALRVKKLLTGDKDLQELLKGSGTALILRIAGIVFGYLFTLAVTRTLGAKAWGIFALCMVVLQISSVIGRLGMDTALLRFTAEYASKGNIDVLKIIYKKILALILPFSVLTAVFVYSISPILSNTVFHKMYLTPYFRVVSLITVPFILLWIHSEGIRGFKKIKEYMLIQQTGVFIIALAVLLMGLMLKKTLFLPLTSYGISVMVLAIISIYMWHNYLRKPAVTNTLSQQTSSISYKSILFVSIPMLISSSLALVMGWTDTIMLGIFRTAQEVGIYNVALKVSLIASLTLTAINTIAAPKFAEFWGKKDRKGLEKIIKQSTRLIFWTSLPATLLILAFPKTILKMFGEKFINGYSSLIILTIGQFINAASGSVNWILNMTDNQHIVQINIAIGTMINLILNYLLIPPLGIKGAAIATTISMIYWNVMGIIYIKHKLGILTFYTLR